MTLDDVKRIKDRHEGRLLALKGVQGVGIAAEEGESKITVYVDHGMPQLADIPRELDDVPVVVEESGVFEAY
jgi:hypothetical protein